MPPVSVRPITAVRTMRIIVVSDSSSCSGKSTMHSAGIPKSAKAIPRRLRVPPMNPRAPRGRFTVATRSWLTRWTSIFPDCAVVVTPTPLEIACAKRPRREAPSTSCVALTPRANSRSDSGIASPDHLVEGAAEVLDEVALAGEVAGRAGAGEPVAGGDVNGFEVGAARAGRDAGGAADERVALVAAGERHDHALLGLPGGGDVLGLAVLLQLVLDLVGQPQQGDLAQCGEVADAEVVREGRVHLLGRVDVAVDHAAAQRLGGDVGEFDLVGAAHDFIGDGLALRHAGDLGDDVVE